MSRAISKPFGKPASETILPYALRWQGRVCALVGLAGLLLVAIVFATTLGSAHIPFSTCFQVFFSQLPFVHIVPAWPETFNTIILDIRIPRILLAGSVGAALAVAGATYQGLFRNPLADPYLLGVASGAGLGATSAFLSLSACHG